MKTMMRYFFRRFSRTGIAPEETMRNVIQLVQQGRKGKANVTPSDVADWSFAKKANEELRR